MVTPKMLLANTSFGGALVVGYSSFKSRSRILEHHFNVWDSGECLSTPKGSPGEHSQHNWPSFSECRRAPKNLKRLQKMLRQILKICQGIIFAMLEILGVLQSAQGRPRQRSATLRGILFVMLKSLQVDDTTLKTWESRFTSFLVHTAGHRPSLS